MSDLLQIGSTALIAAGQALDRTAERLARAAAPSYPGPVNSDAYLDQDTDEYSQLYSSQFYNSQVYSPPAFGGGAVFAQDTAFGQNAGLPEDQTPPLGANLSDDVITQSFAMIAATNQYQAAASLVSTGADLSATLLQTIA